MELTHGHHSISSSFVSVVLVCLLLVSNFWTLLSLSHWLVSFLDNSLICVPLMRFVYGDHCSLR